MNQLADIYAQLDNIVTEHIYENTMDVLDEEFQKEYFSLRDNMIQEFSALLTSQFNYDESVSQKEKNEIIELIQVYYQMLETIQEYPIESLYDMQGHIENILVQKYMYLFGYKKDDQNKWIN